MARSGSAPDPFSLEPGPSVPARLAPSPHERKLNKPQWYDDRWWIEQDGKWFIFEGGSWVDYEKGRRVHSKDPAPDRLPSGGVLLVAAVMAVAVSSLVLFVLRSVTGS
jgi:hypothetical protein